MDLHVDLIGKQGNYMLVIKLILEGLGLGGLLFLFCAVGIHGGAIGMIHLYNKNVQERVISLGMTTEEAIRKRGSLIKGLCIPAYMVYVFVSVYVVNGARGFTASFWQSFVILSIMNLVDRFLIDEYWVGHTKDWEIPGTEDLKPYITSKDMIPSFFIRVSSFDMFVRSRFR